MEEPLSVGIICHPTAGGSGVVASELALALAERGHRIHVFSYERPIRLADPQPRVQVHEVPVTRYPLFKYPPYTLALATKILQVVREKRIDILHAHYAIPHAISNYLAQQMLGPEAPRAITTLHGTDITLIGLDDSYFDIVKFSIELSDGVTAVSDSLASDTRERFGIERPIRVIRNFVDTEEFSLERRDPAIRARFCRECDFLLGHMSNFRTTKRVLDVVRTFHGVTERHPAHLLMIGDGPEREPARQLAEELGLGEHVTFVGEDMNVASLLAQLDLFLMPSQKESFGLAALEATACGVPVIAADIGGLPELVRDGYNGHLLPVGDYRGMAAAAVRLLADRARFAEFSANARRRAVEEFSRDKGVDQYEQFYREIHAGSPAEARAIASVAHSRGPKSGVAAVDSGRPR